MSDLPPNIDAILSSIRSRMNEDVVPEPVLLPAAVIAAPPVAIANVDAVVVGPTTTLESLVRTMLEPMLKTWLDAHMPEIVERTAQAEIKRLTGKD